MLPLYNICDIKHAITRSCLDLNRQQFKQNVPQTIHIILPISCTVSDISRLSDICAWLKGAGTLKLAARSGGFYYARLANQIELTKVLRNHENRIFTLNFRCKPFWYMDQAQSITLTASM